MSGDEGARWQQVKDLLDEALDLPVSERGAFVDRACRDDEPLRR